MPKSGMIPVIDALVQVFGGISKTPSIISIQETHLQVNTSCPRSFFPGHNYVSSPASIDDPYGGIIISYSKALPQPINLLEILLRNKSCNNEIPITSGRFMVLGFQTETNFLIIGSLYGHAKANDQQIPLLRFAFHAMREISMEIVPVQLGNKLEIHTVLMGDLNSYSHHLSELCSPTRTYLPPPKPWSGTTHSNDNNKRRCMDTFDSDTLFPLLNILKSVFMVTHCEALTSYHTNFLRDKVSREIKTGYGIDHFYLSKSMQQKIKCFSSLDSLISSHNILIMTCSDIWVHPLKNAIPKAATLHIPEAIFNIEEFNIRIKDAIETYSVSFANPNEDNAAFRLNHITQIIVPNLAKIFIKEQREQQLQTKSSIITQINFLKQKRAWVTTSPYHQELIQLIHAKRNLYSELLSNRLLSIPSAKELNGIINKHHVRTDKSIPVLIEDHYLRKERTDNTDKIIPGLSDKEGVIHTDPSVLKQIAFDFYKNLFQKNTTFDQDATFDFLARANLPRISETIAEMIDAKFTSEDFLLVLLDFQTNKKGKSTGEDGLPANLYTNETLRLIFASLLADTANYIAKTGTLPDNFRISLIRILSKANQNPNLITNYRPISLLQMCLRMISKAMTNRLNPILHLLIGHQQTAYVPGRKSYHAALLLQQLLLDATIPNSTLLILDIDFQKAFDSISHDYLKALLPLLGFGNRACNFLLAIVTSMITKVLVNDEATEQIHISKGIAQGSSLSAILFILAIEPMLRLARNDRFIKDGVQIGKSLHLKDTQQLPSITDLIYADDVNAPCTTLDALKSWIIIMDLFQNISGLKRNNNKTKIRLIGSAYLTLTNDIISLSKFGEETHKSIHDCPLLNSLTMEYTSDLKIGGIIYSNIDLLKDPACSSSSLFTKSWSNRANGACSRFHTLKDIKETMTMKKKRLFALTKVISFFQFHASSSICPKEVMTKTQIAINNFMYSSNNPPILTALATRKQNQGGYNHINIETRLNFLALSSVQDFISNTLPPPLQSLMQCSLIALLSLIIPERNLQPYLNNPTYVIDALILLNQNLKSTLESLKKPKTPLPSLFTQAPRVLHIWVNSILNTLPDTVNCKRRFNPVSQIDIKLLRRLIETSLNTQPIFHNSAITIPRDTPFFQQTLFLKLNTLKDLRSIKLDKIDLHQRIPDTTITEMQSIKDTKAPKHLIARTYNKDAFNKSWCEIDIPQTRSFLNSTDKPDNTQKRTEYNSDPEPQDYDQVLIDTALHPLSICLPTTKVKEDLWCNIPIHKAKTSIIIRTANTLAYRKVSTFNKFPTTCKYWHRHDPSIFFNPASYAKALKYAMHSGANDLIKDSILALWHHSAVPFMESKNTRFPNMPILFIDSKTLKESNWTTCINCNGCNNPIHFYFKCPTITDFWILMNPTLTSLINNSLPPSSTQSQSYEINLTALLNLGTTFLTNTKPNCINMQMQPLVAILGICFHAICRTWYESFNSGITFTADKIFQKVKSEFENYIFRYINCFLLPSITSTKEDPHNLHQVHPPETKKIICCPTLGPLNFPLISTPLHKSLVAQKLPTCIKETDPFLILIKPYLLVKFENNTPTTFSQTPISNISHFQLPSVTDNTEPTSLTSSLEPTILSPPTYETSSLNQQEVYNTAAHNLIPIPCCVTTHYLMINIFTDGGALHQGSSNALAAYGAIFPDFKKFNYTRAIPNYEPQTNTRAEMYAFIDALPASLNIAKSISHSGPIILNVCTDSDFLINVATKWIKQWSSNNWVNADGSKCLNIDLLQKIIPILEVYHIIWTHVRSHQIGPHPPESNGFWNDRVDKDVSTLLCVLDRLPDQTTH